MIRKALSLVTAFSLFFALSAAAVPEPGHKLRIVSLAPSTTEILFALGLDDEIVGVSGFCDYPEKALSRERIGTFSQPNVERILYLKPDMIFCTGLEQAPSILKLRQLGLDVHVSDPSNFRELFESIGYIGKAVGREAEAEALIQRMKADIESVDPGTKDKRPKVFVEIWHSPITTAGRGSFVDEIIRLAGGTNIASDVDRPYSTFSPEEVIRRDPDCIIVTYMDEAGRIDAFRDRFGWDQISAVKNGRVYRDIDPDIFLRPGPRLVEGLKEIHKRLYR